MVNLDHDHIDIQNDIGSPKVVADQPKVLLRATNLHKSFNGQKVLNGVSVELFESEVVLLRGANGSGKTTLINILTGCIEPDIGQIDTYMNGGDRFDFPRHWWQEINPMDHFLPEKMANKGAGRAWQDIRLFGSQNLLNNIAVAMQRQIGENPISAIFRRRSMRNQEAKNLKEARIQLVRLGLGDRETSSGDSVSLGQAKRTAIARTIAAGAKILFLDEPLSGLDGTGVKEIIGYIRSLVAEQSLTVVIVEHILNMPKIVEFASTVWTLTNGHLSMEKAETVREDIRLDQNDNGLDAWLETVVGPKGNKTITEWNGARITRIIPDGVTPGEILLEINNIHVNRGKRVVFGNKSSGINEPFSLTIRRGEWIIVHAPNGWGKTTLCHAVMGFIPISEGELRWFGQPIDKFKSWHRVRLGLSLADAQGGLFPSLTVKECDNLGYNEEKTNRQANSFRDKPISSLSGGERKRLHLDNILSQKSCLMLLDEPFGSLDSENMIWLKNVLEAHKGESILIMEPHGTENNKEQSERK